MSAGEKCALDAVAYDLHHGREPRRAPKGPPAVVLWEQTASVKAVAHHCTNRVQIQIRIGPHLILDLASEPKWAQCETAL